jgi:hypothetical protein
LHVDLDEIASDRAGLVQHMADIVRTLPNCASKLSGSAPRIESGNAGEK